MLYVTLFLLWQQWKLLSWSIVLHKIRPHGPLLVVTDSFCSISNLELLRSNTVTLAFIWHQREGYSLYTLWELQLQKTQRQYIQENASSTYPLLAGGRQDFPIGSQWVQAQRIPAEQLLWLRTAEVVQNGVFCESFSQPSPLGCGGFLGGTWEDTPETSDMPDLYRCTLK